MIVIIVTSILALVLIVMAFMQYTANEKNTATKALSLMAVLSLIIGTVTYPYANVWQKEMAGRASLAQANADREIKVREALATLDSAKHLANAEVERARGVAEANRIVANGLGGPEGYLRYLFIQSLSESRGQGNQVVYIATEAGVPITESVRFNKVKTVTEEEVK